MKVRYVIPIRHPDGVADRAKQLSELRQTLASVAAQSSTEWTATIVANPAQVLPELPARTRVRHVDLHEHGARGGAQSRRAADGDPARQGPARRRRPRRRRAGRPRHGRRRRRPHSPPSGGIRCVGATRRMGDRQGYWWQSDSRLLERTDASTTVRHEPARAAPLLRALRRRRQRKRRDPRARQPQADIHAAAQAGAGLALDRSRRGSTAPGSRHLAPSAHSQRGRVPGAATSGAAQPPRRPPSHAADDPGHPPATSSALLDPAGGWNGRETTLTSIATWLTRFLNPSVFTIG